MQEAQTSNVEATQEDQATPSQASKAEIESLEPFIMPLMNALKNVNDGDIVGRMLMTSLKLLRDKTSRGDMKLIDRSVAELRYALKIFAPYRDTRKVSIFGSARTPDDAPDYIAAVEYGRKMAEKGWMVITGAGGGIMAAGHGGAGAEPSFGLAIRLPFEQATNAHIAGDPKLINFRYFFTRKLMFVRSSSAVVCFPGGFGTMDEGFEVLTLVQTGKSVPMPIVFVDEPGGTFWNQWQDYVNQQLLRRKLISPPDLHLYKITDNVDEAVAEVCNYYKNYHSIRYVNDILVIRLQHPLSEEMLLHIRNNFEDIKVDGDFISSQALKAERDEDAIVHLPRLVFKFNRRDHGRLRQLIDYLNSAV